MSLLPPGWNDMSTEHQQRWLADTLPQVEALHAQKRMDVIVSDGDHVMKRELAELEDQIKELRTKRRATT